MTIEDYRMMLDRVNKRGEVVDEKFRERGHKYIKYISGLFAVYDVSDEDIELANYHGRRLSNVVDEVRETEQELTDVYNRIICMLSEAGDGKFREQ